MTHQLEIAERLAQLRRKKQYEDKRDIAQSELADIIGVTPETYSRYENGRRKIPDEAIFALATFYGVTPGFIRYGEGEPPRARPTEEEPRREDVEGARRRNQAKRNAQLPPAAGGDRPGPTRRPKPR